MIYWEAYAKPIKNVVHNVVEQLNSPDLEISTQITK